MKPLLSFVLGAMLVLTIACARAPQTPTEIPPTPTTVVYPATWTPVLTPTPTPLPPTRTPDAQTVQVYKAIDRTRGLHYYHAVLDMVVTDPSGTIASQIPGAKRSAPLQILNMEGRQNNQDSQWKMQGLLMYYLSGNVNNVGELVSLGDKLYLNGPLPLLGANEARWYLTPKVPTNDLSSNNATGLLGDFTGLPTMHPEGAENLDDKACTIYRGDQKEAAEFFMSLDPNGNIKRNLGKLPGSATQGIFNVWVCPDGYIHKMELGIQLQTQDKTPQTIGIDITLKINDMNIIVPIPAPQNAIPLPKPLSIPGYGTPSPQPTPTNQTS